MASPGGRAPRADPAPPRLHLGNSGSGEGDCGGEETGSCQNRLLFSKRNARGWQVLQSGRIFGRRAPRAAGLSGCDAAVSEGPRAAPRMSPPTRAAPWRLLGFARACGGGGGQGDWPLSRGPGHSGGHGSGHPRATATLGEAWKPDSQGGCVLTPRGGRATRPRPGRSRRCRADPGGCRVPPLLASLVLCFVFFFFFNVLWWGVGRERFSSAQPGSEILWILGGCSRRGRGGGGGGGLVAAPALRPPSQVPRKWLQPPSRRLQSSFFPQLQGCKGRLSSASTGGWRHDLLKRVL